MDVNMPGSGGVDGVRAIRGAGYATKIVMLTVSEDDDDLFDSISAGANGYLLKNIRPEILFDDLRGVMRGEAPIAPGIAHKLLDALRDGPPRPRAQAVPADGETALTRRETEILQLVAAGLSNKEIATQLTITEGTVKNHVHNALEKLHLSNRIQAAAYTVAQGLGPRSRSRTAADAERARRRDRAARVAAPNPPCPIGAPLAAVPFDRRGGAPNCAVGRMVAGRCAP